MPHKNPRCSECGRKMKHDRWVEFVRYNLHWLGNWSYRYGELWKRVVKCPNCGTERFDFKNRKLQKKR